MAAGESLTAGEITVASRTTDLVASLIVAFKVSVAIGLGLFGAASARADTVLLSLTDIGYTETLYNLDFIANASTTSLSVGGYEPDFVWVAAINSVTPLGGGANMLGDTWTFVPASSGSAAYILSDVISVPALGFGGTTVGSYDTFSQTFATTPGTEYVYQFMLYNDLASPDFANPSGILVTTTASAAPEPSTWAMMILGFLGVGFIGFRRAWTARATFSSARSPTSVPRRSGSA
jgi:hypothetical protein